MKVLKKIGFVYLVILLIVAFVWIVMFPIFFYLYFENANFLWLFLINIPLILGISMMYIDADSERPKR